jgi:hypothetical protein
MAASSFIDSMLLWVFNLLVSATVLLSHEAGWCLGNYRRQRAENESMPVNSVLGATLGVLALT